MRIRDGPATVTGKQDPRLCHGRSELEGRGPAAIRESGHSPPVRVSRRGARREPLGRETQEVSRNAELALDRSVAAETARGAAMRHPIELESYRIMRRRADLTHLPPLTRGVVERVVHSTADTSWIGEIVAAEPDLRAGWTALRSAAPLIADVRMVAAGITTRPVDVGIDYPGATDIAAADGVTRSAAGIRLAAETHPDGAVWVIGNAPTALAELVRLAEGGRVRPALVVGVPVGFVGAVSAKAALRRSGLPAISTVTERGGAAIAAAAVNALLYAENGAEAETWRDPARLPGRAGTEEGAR